MLEEGESAGGDPWEESSPCEADPKNVVHESGKRFMLHKSPHPTIISLMPVSLATKKCNRYSH